MTLKKGSPEAKAWGREMARLRKLHQKIRKDDRKVRSLEREQKSKIHRKRSTSMARTKTRTVTRYVRRGWSIKKKHYELIASLIVGGILGYEISRRS